LASFQLHTQFQRSQQKGYNMPVVELQNFFNDIVTATRHIWAAQEAHRPHLTTHEAVDFLRSVIWRVQRSRALNDIEAKDPALVEVVVIVAIVEAVADVFRALAELISTPTLEL
jgi:hypothetical protein